MSRRFRAVLARPALLALLAPLLLTVMALRQIHAAHGYGLSPWKGGGFGMFSSVDRINCRVLRAHLVVDGETLLLALGDVGGLGRPLRRALVAPSPDRLADVAALLERQRWTIEDADADGPALPYGGSCTSIAHGAARPPERPALDSALAGGATGEVAGAPGGGALRIGRLVSDGTPTVGPVVRGRVRLEVLRVRFDADERRAQLERLAVGGAR